MSFGQRVLTGRQHRRGEAFQFRQEGRGAEQEHTAVPVIIAGGQITLGGGLVGFFDKAFHRTNASIIQRSAGLDVAIAGFRGGGDDAEGDQVSGFRLRRDLENRGAKAGDIGDDMIGGQDQQQWISAAILALGVQGGDSDCWRGVAAHRFEHDRGGMDAHRPQLLGDHEAMLFIAHHHRCGHVVQAGDAQGGVLQHGVAVRQRQKLFGIGLAGQRP